MLGALGEYHSGIGPSPASPEFWSTMNSRKINEAPRLQPYGTGCRPDPVLAEADPCAVVRGAITAHSCAASKVQHRHKELSTALQSSERPAKVVRRPSIY